MSEAVASLHEVARFLREYAPFDALRPEEVEELARSARIEFVRKGTLIFGQDVPCQDNSFVVRSGAVELIDGDTVIDLLGPGEVFGHPSMMSGLPTSAASRAVEDTLLYRLEGAVARPLLARPEGMRFVARTLLERYRRATASSPVAADLMATPIARLVRPGLICPADISLREAAQRMTAAGQSSLVVDLEGRRWGLLADSDLRAKVVAGPLTPDDPVSAAMTAPAFTVDGDRSGSEVMLEMLDRQLRHVPVIGEEGRVIGIARAADILAATSRAPFLCRDAIATAATVAELAHVSVARLEAAAALHRSGHDSAHAGAMLAVLDDALMRRLADLGHEELGPPPLPVGWLVFGSRGRREPALSSDVDCGLHWIDHADDGSLMDEARSWSMALGRFVLNGIVQCGLQLDEHGVRPDNGLVARSLSSWQGLIDGLAKDPWRRNAISLVAILADGRTVTGPPDAAGLIGFVHEAVHKPEILRLLLRVALGRGTAERRHAPSRRFPIRPSQKVVDLKHEGLAPIVDIARWAAISAGSAPSATQQRLRVAATAGVIDDSDARTLIEAHVLLSELRFEHQVGQLERGKEPDNIIALDTLDSLTRTYLREALREIAHVRRRLEAAAQWS